MLNMLLGMALSPDVAVRANDAQPQAQASSYERSHSSAPSAMDLMVDFTRTLCLSGQNPLQAAERLVPSQWQPGWERTERNIAFGVDAPVPIHDQTWRTWRGPLKRGMVLLAVNFFDNHDPSLRDHFYATISVYPDTLIDLAAFQQRLNVTLRPTQPPLDGARARVTIIDNGRPLPRRPQQYGHLQHYSVETRGVENIQIRAMHVYGRGFPEQAFSVTCSPG